MDKLQVELSNVIQQQEIQIVNLKDAVASEQQKKQYVIPALTLIIGAVLGFFIIK